MQAPHPPPPPQTSSSIPPPPPRRIKRQRRKLRGKYSGDCVSCNAKWSKCWYIASVENQPEWEARLAISIRPYDDEVCFQCWDGKIRTSPKRKLSKVEDDDPPLTTTTTTSGPSPLSTSTTTATQLEEGDDEDDPSDPPLPSSSSSSSSSSLDPPSSSSSYDPSSSNPSRRSLTIEVPAPTPMEISLRKSADSPGGKVGSPMSLQSPPTNNSPRRVEKTEKMDSPKRPEKMERIEKVEKIDPPRKPESPRWRAEVSPRGQHKRILVDNYWNTNEADIPTTTTETTTSQIRQTQVEAHHSHSDYEGDSVFEEHEAVFLLSTAFKTFPSSPKMNSSGRRAPEG